MKTRYVIKNTPFKYPITHTVMWILLLDRFQASVIIWTVFITIYSLLWVVVIASKFYEKEVDLFKDYSGESENQKKSFSGKLNEAIEKAKKENGL